MHYQYQKQHFLRKKLPSSNEFSSCSLFVLVLIHCPKPFHFLLYLNLCIFVEKHKNVSCRRKHNKSFGWEKFGGKET